MTGKGERKTGKTRYVQYEGLGSNALRRHEQAIGEILAGTRQQRGDNRKLRRYEKLGTRALQRRQRAIGGVLSRRRWNVPWSKFADVHSEPDCQVEEVYEGSVPSGFVEIDFMTQIPAFLFRRRCVTHGGTSERIADLSWHEGAVDTTRR